MKIKPSHLALSACLFSISASAQVAFIMDVMTSHMCIANNWETPSWKQQFADLNDAQKNRMRMALELQFSPETIHCLEETKPYPEAACATVIERARGGVPVVGGGEPFIGAAVKTELELGDAKASHCLGLKNDAGIS